MLRMLLGAGALFALSAVTAPDSAHAAPPGKPKNPITVKLAAAPLPKTIRCTPPPPPPPGRLTTKPKGPRPLPDDKRGNPEPAKPGQVVPGPNGTCIPDILALPTPQPPDPRPGESPRPGDDSGE